MNQNPERVRARLVTTVEYHGLKVEYPDCPRRTDNRWPRDQIFAWVFARLRRNPRSWLFEGPRGQPWSYPKMYRRFLALMCEKLRYEYSRRRFRNAPIKTIKDSWVFTRG